MKLILLLLLGNVAAKDIVGNDTNYTVVIDDFMWLSLLVVLAIIAAWACCLVDTPQKPVCCTTPQVIHVKIDSYDQLHPKKTHTPCLTRQKSCRTEPTASDVDSD